MLAGRDWEKLRVAISEFIDSDGLRKSMVPASSVCCADNWLASGFCEGPLVFALDSGHSEM